MQTAWRRSIIEYGALRCSPKCTTASGAEAFEDGFKKRIIAQVAYKQFDVFVADTLPHGNPFLDGRDGSEAMGAEFIVVAPTEPNYPRMATS
jgi:hypothetical protein